MKTVLIVEDDPDMLKLISHIVAVEGQKVLTAPDGESALSMLREHKPDLVILDWMLPGMDGLEVCRRARAFTHVPIIMLTGKGEETDRIVGLETGADDYIVKPVSPGELRARVRAHLRRELFWKNGTEHDEQRLLRGPLVLDSGCFEATLDGGALDLTRLEFDLLFCLASRPGIVFSREHLLEVVWHDNEYIVPRGIDVHISRLRQKTEKDPSHPELILTVHGVGYKFNPSL